jgi:outer membrane protein assembly factor BamB
VGCNRSTPLPGEGADATILDAAPATDASVAPDLAVAWNPDRYRCTPQTGWSAFHADTHNSGFACALGGQTGAVQWRYSDQSTSDYRTPVIAADGTIYLAAAQGNGDGGSLVALATDGTLKWTFPIGQPAGAPAIARDGTVFVNTYTNGQFAIAPDGTQKWHIVLNGAFQSGSPTIGPDGTIYVASADSTEFYALAPDGTTRWAAIAYGNWNGTPAIADDGTVYLGNVDHHLYAFGDDGVQRWNADLSTPVNSSPAIGPDGTIYVVTAALSSEAWAVDPKGNVLWHAPLDPTGFDDEVDSTPAVAPDGTVYFASPDGMLHSFAGGREQWSVSGGTGRFLASPAIGADGTVYVCNEDGLISAITPEGRVVWSHQGHANEGNPSIAGGRVYVSSFFDITVFD